MPPSFHHLPIARVLCILSVFIVAGGLLAPASANAWSPTFQIGLESNNNVTKAIREEKSDSALTASLDLSTLHILNRDWQLSYGGSVQTSAWQEYDGLNLTEIGAHGTLRRKFGLGPYAPRLELRAEVAHQLSKVEEWSGNWVRVGATFAKRFSPQWQASLNGVYEQLYAERDVYSTVSTTTTLTVDFDPTDVWRFSGSVGYTDGDHLSWCRNSWSSFVGTTKWLDGIFGGDWFPYQSVAHTVAGAINLSRAIGPNSTLTLGYSVSETRSVKNHIYRDKVISLQFIHAF